MASSKLIAVFNWLHNLPFPTPLIPTAIMATYSFTTDATSLLFTKAL